jgi:hypothetical protein
MSTKSDSKLLRTVLVVLVAMTAPLWLVLGCGCACCSGTATVGPVRGCVVLVGWPCFAARSLRVLRQPELEGLHRAGHTPTAARKQRRPELVSPQAVVTCQRIDLALSSIRGYSRVNPIGLVFERFGLVTRYRFVSPFREMKHGRPETLQVLEERFFAHLAG